MSWIGRETTSLPKPAFASLRIRSEVQRPSDDRSPRSSTSTSKQRSSTPNLPWFFRTFRLEILRGFPAHPAEESSSAAHRERRPKKASLKFSFARLGSHPITSIDPTQNTAFEPKRNIPLVYMAPKGRQYRNIRFHGIIFAFCSPVKTAP